VASMRRSAVNWRWTMAAVLLLGGRCAFGDGLDAVVSPRVSVVGQAGLRPSDFTPPGQDAPIYDAGRQNWIDSADRDAVLSAPPNLASVVSPVQSTWYYRLDSFTWNERVDGEDFVNEYGPLSTLGYLRRNGMERFRFELFGGTVAYDGAAQSWDEPDEPFHQSFGTNYLGLRGEYDLLIEPAGWPWLRYVCGIGTRFWIRDLRNGVTPSGATVIGYQETWWTVYPYLGLEVKNSNEPGPEFFGSIRLGATPLTYQRVTYFDTNSYPSCGITGQAEVGVRYERLSLSLCFEAMTWGKSGVIENAYEEFTYQPASRMITIGGKVSYAF
jgi:hypothetical protein